MKIEQLKEMIEDAVDQKIAPLTRAAKGDKNIVGFDGPEGLSELDRTGGFSSFAEFAKSVYDAGPDRMNANEKLRSWVGHAKSAGDPTLEIGDPEQGGYLVPTEFSSNLLKMGLEKSYWLDELAAKTAKKPKFGQVKLRLNKLVGFAYASDELIQDSAVSLQPLLTSVFTDAFAWNLDWVMLNGTGAGQPRGLLADPALISVSAETGQAATTIVAENIIKMYARMYPAGHKKAIWIANPDTFSQLATMSIAVGTGGVPVYLPANSVAGRPYQTLMGRPLIFSEHAQTLGTSGDIYYVDWSQYLVGQKAGAGAGLSFATSIHLKFDYDQTAFRWVFRIDGQGWWPSALTPRYSSDTVSPFIVLEDR